MTLRKKTVYVKLQVMMVLEPYFWRLERFYPSPWRRDARQPKSTKNLSTMKFGIRHNNHGDIRKFKCKSCNRFFSINIGFAKMKHNPQGITTAMQLYFSGESLRNTAESLRLIGVDVSYQTIYNWIRKYTTLMNEYLEQIQPKVSGAWRTDELHLKIKGNMKYLYALMDDETSFV
jgi:putative transposase